MAPRAEILIAEDEPTARRGFRILFEGEGYAVRTARDGEEALAKFKEHRPDAVLLDVMMPRMNGIAACAEIRKIDPLVPSNGLIIVGEKATTIGQSHAAPPACIAGDKAACSAAIAAGDKAARYNHYREFVEACLAKDLEKCGSKLSYAAPLTEALLIGCIALRFPGEELAFDAKTMRFTNKPEANEFLRAPKRGEWDFAKLAAR